MSEDMDYVLVFNTRQQAIDNIHINHILNGEITYWTETLNQYVLHITEECHERLTS